MEVHIMSKTQTAYWFAFLTVLSWAGFLTNAWSQAFHPIVQIYMLFGGILGFVCVAITWADARYEKENRHG